MDSEELEGVIETLGDVADKIEQEVKAANKVPDLLELVEAMQYRNETLKVQLAATATRIRYKFTEELVIEYSEMANERQKLIQSMKVLQKLIGTAVLGAILSACAETGGFDEPDEQTE